MDRTAVFVGDRAMYTVELATRRGIDVLADDLAADKLKLDGLELVGSDSSREPGRDGSTIHRFRYIVTTYRANSDTSPALTVGPLVVRYASVRPGQRLEEAAPAGQVQIPGQSLAVRSVLPADQDISGVRSDRAASARPAVFAMLRPLGVGLVIVSIVPAALAGTAVVRRRHANLAKGPRRSARTVRHAARASLDAVRAMDFASVAARRDALTQLDALVREHLRDVCGIPGPSLTPAEIAPALASRGSRVPAELVTSVLTACERARYAPATPSAEMCRETLDQVEQVIAAR